MLVTVDVLSYVYIISTSILYSVKYFYRILHSAPFPSPLYISDKLQYRTNFNFGQTSISDKLQFRTNLVPCGFFLKCIIVSGQFSSVSSKVLFLASWLFMCNAPKVLSEGSYPTDPLRRILFRVYFEITNTWVDY